MLHLTKTKLKHDGGMFDSLPCASDDEDAVFVSSLELSTNLRVLGEGPISHLPFIVVT